MSLSAYANMGWVQECRDTIAMARTLPALEIAVSAMEQSRPSWVTDESVLRVRRAYQSALARIQSKG